jgi:hypothetical protein
MEILFLVLIREHLYKKMMGVPFFLLTNPHPHSKLRSLVWSGFLKASIVLSIDLIPNTAGKIGHWGFYIRGYAFLLKRNG